MSMLIQALRQEHKELLPHIEKLRAVADMVGDAPIDAVRQGVEDVYAFLVHHLIPHAEAEERALYPAVARLMGAPEAIKTMSRDHIEVGHLTEELRGLRPALAAKTLDAAQANALRRVLYGLHALVKVHFAKEEEIYLPILEARLTEQDARALLNEMDGAAHAASHHAH